MRKAKKLLARIDEAYDKRKEQRRGYLGASSLGDKCARALWYGFRWAGEPSFPPRIKRLFERGDREEQVFVDLLWKAGCVFWPINPATRKQYTVPFNNPHIGGHCDGVGKGLPDIPEGELFVGEFKTHNKNQFNQLIKKGVKHSHFKHYIQLQLYMKGLGVKWGLYGAVCKDDDHLHLEVIPYDEVEADRHCARGDTIVYSQQPPTRLSNNPVYYECKWCDHQKVCHYGEQMLTNCRTCAFAIPLPREAADDKERGAWYCNRHKTELSLAAQKAGCGDYIQLTLKD